MTPDWLSWLAAGLLALLTAVLIFRARAERATAVLNARLGEQLAAARRRAEDGERRAAELQAQLAAREALVSRLQSDLSTAHQERAGLQAELGAERRAATEKLALFDRAREALKETFGTLSADALRSNNESFLQMAGASLERSQQTAATDLATRHQEIAGLVEPLRESLGKISDHLRQVDLDRASTSQSLVTHLQSVVETQERLRRETEGLVRALRSPNQRGRWGEVQLRNVIERAGMTAYCGDFTEKDALEDRDGRRFVPDMTIRLPNGSCIVIDSKVPIDAYLRAIEAADDQQRDSLLRDHARQVREHIKGLSRKAYWMHFTPTPELVVMFLPGEPLFSTALQFDPTLFDFAADQRVIPASPLTLLALLRTVASAWQQQRLTENAEEIRALGKELYERLATMADYVEDVGLNLRQAGAAYDRFVGSLDSRVLAAARRFRDLGVTTAKELPDPAPVHLEVREPRAPELRVPRQEVLIEAEIVGAASEPLNVPPER